MRDFIVIDPVESRAGPGVPAGGAKSYFNLSARAGSCAGPERAGRGHGGRGVSWTRQGP